MVYGPREYLPGKEVSVVEKIKAIPLGENEGIYVRNLTTGKVRLERGPQSFLLSYNEELWSKKLSPTIERLINHNLSGGGFAPASLNAKGEMVYQYHDEARNERDYHRAV